MSRPPFREAALIRKIRSLTKLSSTYTDMEKIDPDSRIRCSYNPVGTKFSRASSDKSLFGTGMNMQNWPHKMLRFLVPDDGFAYFSFDLAQAENRLVAYFANVHEMIEAFESGKDVHSLTASRIFDKPWQVILQEDKDEVHCNLGNGDKTRRFWGKKSNHSLNYDESAKTFALQCEITERDAKVIVEGYHAGYHGSSSKHCPCLHVAHKQYG